MKKLTVFLAILLTIGLLGVFYYTRQQRISEVERYARLQQQAAPLEQQLSQLQKEMEQAKHDYENQVKGTATIELVVSQLDEPLYYDAFPQMEQYSFPGVMVLGKQWPGDEGCISEKQFWTMLDAGWGYALCWSNEEGWLERAEKRLMRLGLNRPTAVYFPDGEYYEDRRDDLSGAFSIFLHHGETGQAMLVTQARSDRWELGVSAWDYDSSTRDIRNAAIKAGNRVYEITFVDPDAELEEAWDTEDAEDSEETGASDEEDAERRRPGTRSTLYDYDAYKDFLDALNSSVDEGKLVVTDLDRAWALRITATGKTTQMTEELEQVLSQYEAQMEALEQQIDQIYAEG